ncbi:MAG: Rap1a/Tai family immunity protein [Spirochaetia bacterium]
MRKLYVLAFALAVLAGCTSTPIGGQGNTDLWQSYQKTSFANQEEAAKSIYTGFVSSGAQVMLDAGWLSASGITYGQMAAVVGKYLDDHPEQWNLDAEVLVYRALYAVWPGTKDAPYR